MSSIDESPITGFMCSQNFNNQTDQWRQTDFHVHEDATIHHFTECRHENGTDVVLVVEETVIL